VNFKVNIPNYWSCLLHSSNAGHKNMAVKSDSAWANYRFPDRQCRRRHTLYNVLTDCGIPTKLVTLIKMNLSDTHSKVCTGKQVWCIYSDWYKYRTYFTSSAFQLRFRITPYNNQNGIETKGTHQFVVCANDVNLLDVNVNMVQ